MPLFHQDNTILIDAGGLLFRIFKVTPHSDGGFNVHIPYHNDKTGYLYKIRIPYPQGTILVPFTAITEQRIIDKDVKLSIHRSGFVQFSGPGVVSGIDEATQRPKGLGIKIGPLTKPITSGPTFIVSIWGLEDFQVLNSKEDKKNYITFKIDDFNADPPNAKRHDTLKFECFLFPTSLAGEVDPRGGQPTLTRPFSNHVWQPGKVFHLKVIFLKNSPVFIGILPHFSEWGFGDRGKSGYQIDGPSEIVGRNNENILEGIHLKAVTRDLDS
jgi:hypothetical protein